MSTAGCAQELPRLGPQRGTREYLRRKLPQLQDRLRAFGAIPIDARQPIDQVVDAILRFVSDQPRIARDDAARHPGR